MNAQAMFLAASVFFFAIGFIGTQKHTTEDNRAATLNADVTFFERRP